MKTITLKVEEDLANWLELEARRLGWSKSELAREALERHRIGKSGLSVHDRMKDVCGIIKGGPRDLARNMKKYMKDFGK